MLKTMMQRVSIKLILRFYSWAWNNKDLIKISWYIQSSMSQGVTAHDLPVCGRHLLYVHLKTTWSPGGFALTESPAKFWPKSTLDSRWTPIALHMNFTWYLVGWLIKNFLFWEILAQIYIKSYDIIWWKIIILHCLWTILN